ncbi:Imm51 family immunity protein [Nonomuraea angiospora]
MSRPPGKYALLLDAGTTQGDNAIEELGHEPNGYFWEGVAQVLVSPEAPALEGRFSYGPEDRDRRRPHAVARCSRRGERFRVRRLTRLLLSSGCQARRPSGRAQSDVRPLRTQLAERSAEHARR